MTSRWWIGFFAFILAAWIFEWVLSATFGETVGRLLTLAIFTAYAIHYGLKREQEEERARRAAAPWLNRP